MTSSFDPEHFRRLLEAHRDRIYRVAAAYLRDGDVIEDAVQETWVKAWEAISALRSQEAFTFWLDSIARNTCLSILRSAKREQAVRSKLACEMDRTGQGIGADLETRRIADSLLDLLTEKQRAIMALHYLEGYKLDEIAAFKGVSPGTVKTTLSRARNTLRRKVGIMPTQTIIPVEINRKLSAYPKGFDLSEPDRAYATYMNLIADRPFWEEVDVLEVLTDGRFHAVVIGYLIGPDIRMRFDIRGFVRRGTEWENLGNDRRDSLTEAREIFQRTQQRIVVLRRLLEGDLPRPEDVCPPFRKRKDGVAVQGMAVLRKERFKDMLVARLDDEWDQLVPVQADGSFVFPSVAPGRHRATLFLAMNQRGHGVGAVDFVVEEGREVDAIRMEMEPLAEVHAVLTDEEGRPLKGFCLGATWRADGKGLWIEGSRSDGNGNCFTFLPLKECLYLKGIDGSGRRSMSQPVEIAANSEEQIDLGEVVVPLRENRSLPTND